MKRMRMLILVFVIALAVPLGYLVHRTQLSLEQEETAELRFFANTLLDQLEQELAALVQREEQRPVDEYQWPLPATNDGVEGDTPLARWTTADYVVGYIQNNPDGSFTAPLFEGENAFSPDRTAALKRLENVNRIFNTKRSGQPEVQDRMAAAIAQKDGAKEQKTTSNKEDGTGFAGKYLDTSRTARQKAHLGQAEKRVEQISPRQAMNLAQREEQQETDTKRNKAASSAEVMRAEDSGTPADLSVKTRLSETSRPPVADPVARIRKDDGFRVEIDPLQSVYIDQGQVFVFRRIVVDNQVFRQGLVIRVEGLLNQLKEKYFSGQPMAGFANLSLTTTNGGHETIRVTLGPEIINPRFSLERNFPRPFSFVRATLASDVIPRSPGRTTLYVMIVAAAAVIILGLFAIYQSARLVTDLSERRAGFVSSVTHEIKTPLTNIRMYIEMLEQGIALDPERELEYYRILESESARLSRLINNVLEFSKLEKKQRLLNLCEGTLDEVFSEVSDTMQEWLRKEGFLLKMENFLDHPFHYDREVMVQILVNLVENSIKFGNSAPRREISVSAKAEKDRIVIRVSDTGPGIPSHALKKIFDDFYRVDNALTRTTKGTGIGLALVKRFVESMGGSVSAANNQEVGCTITISFPSVLSRSDVPQ